MDIDGYNCRERWRDGQMSIELHRRVLSAFKLKDVRCMPSRTRRGLSEELDMQDLESVYRTLMTG